MALATCRALPAGDDDARHWSTPWRCNRSGPIGSFGTIPRVDWTAFELTVIRSTWDYTGDREEFLALDGERAPSAQPAPVIAWNSDKTYLRELADGRASRRCRRDGSRRARRSNCPTPSSSSSRPWARVRRAPAASTRATSERRRARGARRGAARRRTHRHGAALPGRRRPRGEAASGLLRRRVQPRDHEVGDAGARRRSTRSNPATRASLFMPERISRAPPSAPNGHSPTRPGLRQPTGSGRCSTPGSTCCRRPTGPVLIELELTEPSLFLQPRSGRAPTGWPRRSPTAARSSDDPAGRTQRRGSCAR